jgi:thioredoxin-like negative regulator of GroEL
MALSITTQADMISSIAANRTVIVEVHAVAWCAPCRAIAPHFEKTAVDLGHAHMFLSVDIDAADEDLVDMLSVTSLPSFILFVDGKEVSRFAGADKEKLASMLQRADPEWNTSFWPL